MIDQAATRRPAPIAALAACALSVGISFGLWGCEAAPAGAGAETESETEAVDPSYATHDEPADYVVDPDDGKADGVPATFDRNLVLDEAFFIDTTSVDADDVQLFLEQSPYKRPCFLATEMVGEMRASDAIAWGAAQMGVNPIVLLARLQVERSMIAKESRPSSHSIDFAFGCGCPDYQDCNEAYRGFDAQIECAAETFASLHELSVDGSGQWVRGESSKSLDGYWVKPTNHATASMYGYTPWVLPGSGGNWLVWNVTRKFIKHFRVLGVIE